MTKNDTTVNTFETFPFSFNSSVVYIHVGGLVLPTLLLRISPLTSSDINGTRSLNVISASTESFVFFWETDHSSIPFLLWDLAIANGLSLHVPISKYSLPRSGLCLRTAWICFATFCTVPIAEPAIRPPSVSLHEYTHFAKAEVTSF
ncbi:MAG: hypothetical protein K0U78_02765 [Actinomycetia bacterium]|nr:hypothetical protein [Actinomycetes bacterium]